MRNPGTSSRIVLLEDTRAVATSGPLRRYRLARLRLEARPDDPEERLAHLKRVYD